MYKEYANDYKIRLKDIIDDESKGSDLPLALVLDDQMLRNKLVKNDLDSLVDDFGEELKEEFRAIGAQVKEIEDSVSQVTLVEYLKSELRQLHYGTNIQIKQQQWKTQDKYLKKMKQ